MKNTRRRRSGTATTTLYIRNMVCQRCINTVRHELIGLRLDVRRVELGEVELSGVPSAAQVSRIRDALGRSGFELIEDRRMRLIEKVRHAILALARNDHEANPIRRKLSEYIAGEVGKDYASLSALFSSVENITIERYLILQRIEYVKELLKYGDLTLSEISYKLGYSSVQHLSAQFKSLTGMTPTAFKRSGASHRHPLDHLGH